MSGAEADVDDDLARLNELWHEYREIVDALDEELAEFVDGHPVFVERFGLHDENGGEGQPRIYSHELTEPVRDEADPTVTSEWEFAVVFGYKEALADLTAAIDGRTSLPTEEVEDGDE